MTTRLLALALLLPTPALACGGFFCDATFDPVVQTAERVLFRVNPDGTVTSVIEVQYEGEPTNFAWVLPLPEAIDPQTVGTASAGLFDALEEWTAPRFVTADAMGDAAGVAEMAAGCSCSSPFWGGMGVDDSMGMPDVSGVEVVGASVVGPYALEVITADEPGALQSWLAMNGYPLPGAAQQPIANYVSAGMAFLGVKLAPTVPAGPIDALEITFAADAPSLPLMLTSVAAAEDMDVTVYVLGDERYGTTGYAEHTFDWSQVSWVGSGRTDYEDLLPAEIDAVGGRGFVTEFAGPVEALELPARPAWREDAAPGVTAAESAAAELLRSGRYLTRVRTMISPDEMTFDPHWRPAPERGDVSNVHAIGPNAGATAAFPVWTLLLAGMAGVVGRRRR